MAIGPMRRVAGLAGGRADVRRSRHGSCGPPSRVHHVRDHGALRQGHVRRACSHKWMFDEFYTAMAIEGLDKNKDGVYDREELAELAKVNIEGLKDFAYFTFPGARRQGDCARRGARLLARAQGRPPVAALHAAVREPRAVGGQGADHLGLRSRPTSSLSSPPRTSRRGSAKARPRGARPRLWPPPRSPATTPRSERCRRSSAPMAPASPRPSPWSAAGPDRTLLPISLLPAKCRSSWMFTHS